jgi:hypothetical protein
MVRKFKSVWKPARIVSFLLYLTRSEAVGARRWGLEDGVKLSVRNEVGLVVHPYFPASLNVSRGRPRPMDTISARSSTLQHTSICYL